MSLYKSFRTDENSETKGVKLVYNFKPEYQNEDGTWPTFYVKRCGGRNSTEVEKARDRARRSLGEDIDLTNLTEEQSLSILVKSFVDAVLIGWENIFVEDEKPVQFNTDNAIKFFTELSEFFLELHAKTVSRNLFLKYREADVKNS